MKIHLAEHYGLCFGVRDALAAAQEAASQGPVTVLGQIVHNPIARRRLSQAGAGTADLDQPGSAPTSRIIITAHGASDQARNAWREAGHEIVDTTCPLVRQAHEALGRLVAAGYHPVVIGDHDHVEVRGLTGDFPEASVILDEGDLAALPSKSQYGVIAQTTQPVSRVEALVGALRTRFPQSEVRFRNTVCQPTRQRQAALETLCGRCDCIVVIGGRNSNNTGQLVRKAERLVGRVVRVERASELRREWFEGVEDVGVTAGTSTLEETVREVVERLREFQPETVRQ